MSRKRTNEPDKPRLALVPRAGCTCEACLMQASRGFIFHREFNPHGLKNMSCKCTFMPGDKNTKIEGYDPSECYDKWKTIKSVREQLGFEDSKMQEILHDMNIEDLTSLTKEMVLEHLAVSEETPETIQSQLAAHQITLPSAEYGKVIHDINTVFYARFDGREIGTITITQGKETCSYTFLVNGFNDYTIIRKRLIV